MMLLATSLAYRARIDLRLTWYQWDEVRLLQAAKKAVAECGAIEKPPTDGSYIAVPDGLCTVTDESGRINLNTAPREVLQQLFGPYAALVPAVLAWRTPVQTGASDPYQRAGYASRNGPFKSVDELLLVDGMAPEVFKQVAGFLTVSGEGGINLNTASERVLLALGLSPSVVAKVLQYRQDVLSHLTPQESQALAPLLQSGRLSQRSAARHMNMTVKLNDRGISRHYEIVASYSTPIRIFSWRETYP